MSPRKEVIGDCELWLGDAREVAAFVPRNVVVVTDPPYGIGHSSNYGASWQGTRIANDDSTAVRDAVLEPFENVAAFGSWKTPPIARTKGTLVWDKGPAFGMGDLKFPWKPSWELIYIRGSIWRGQTREPGVLRGHMQVSWERHPNVPESQRRQHPHQKPVSLCASIIEKVPAETTIFDPFLGSGTTGVAATMLGYRFIGVEVEPKYFDIARRRMERAVSEPKQQHLFEGEAA